MGIVRQPTTPRAFLPHRVFSSDCQLGYGFGYLSLPVFDYGLASSRELMTCSNERSG